MGLRPNSSGTRSIARAVSSTTGQAAGSSSRACMSLAARCMPSADEILENQLSFCNLLDHLSGAVPVAAESVRGYRRQVSGEFHVGEQRQQVRIALVQPLGYDAVHSRSPARDHRSEVRATSTDDATGFTQRLDPVGPFLKVVERTEQHHGVDR